MRANLRLDMSEQVVTIIPKLIVRGLGSADQMWTSGQCGLRFAQDAIGG